MFPMVEIGALSHPEPGSFKIGPFGSSLKKDELSESGFPVVGIENILPNRFVSQFRRFITEEKFRELSQYEIKLNDILVTTMGTIGRAAVVPEDAGRAIIDSHLFRMRIDQSRVFAPYLCYAINGYQDLLKQLQREASGAIMAGLNTKILRECRIPLPSLQEQKRIAAILNVQMTVVERARAATEAQLEAAHALPAAYLRTVFDSPNANRWPEKKLGEVLRLRKDVVHPHDKPRGPAIFVGLEHIEPGTGTRIGSLSVEMSALTGRKPRFYAGDIVYGYLRPYLNKVWIAEFDGLCSVDQYVYSVDADIAIADFVAWFMRSTTYLKRAPIGTTPGQLPRIRTEEVAATTINLPPITEQRRVVACLSENLSAGQQTIKLLEEKLKAIEKLPTATLRRAFNGEL